MLMRPNIALTLCLIVAPTIFAGEPQINGTPSDLAEFLKGVPKTVTLTGESEVKVQSDEAIISLNVRSDHKTLECALKQNEDLRNKIASMLSQRGLANDSIKGAKFSSTPRNGMFSDKAKSYLVENIVKITVHSDREFQAVAGVVDALSDVRYLGIDFEHTDKDAVRARALAEACDKASAKKKLFEDKLGIKLVPQRLSEGIRTTPMRRYPGPVLMEAMTSSAAMTTPIPDSTGGYSRSAVPDAMEAGPSSFGELACSAVVTIEYSVEK